MALRVAEVGRLRILHLVLLRFPENDPWGPFFDKPLQFVAIGGPKVVAIIAARTQKTNKYLHEPFNSLLLDTDIVALCDALCGHTSVRFGPTCHQGSIGHACKVDRLVGSCRQTYGRCCCRALFRVSSLACPHADDLADPQLEREKVWIRYYYLLCERCSPPLRSEFTQKQSGVQVSQTIFLQLQPPITSFICKHSTKITQPAGQSAVCSGAPPRHLQGRVLGRALQGAPRAVAPQPGDAVRPGLEASAAGPQRRGAVRLGGGDG
jgi:hypothetical protein